MEIFVSQKLSIPLLAFIWIQKGGKTKEKLPVFSDLSECRQKDTISQMSCLVACSWDSCLFQPQQCFSSFLFDLTPSIIIYTISTFGHRAEKSFPSKSNKPFILKIPQPEHFKIDRTFFFSSKMIFLVSGSVSVMMTTFSIGKKSSPQWNLSGQDDVVYTP